MVMASDDVLAPRQVPTICFHQRLGRAGPGDGSARGGRRESALPGLTGGPGMRCERFGGKRGAGRTMKVSAI
jgi:hypothetical protein